MDDKIPLRYLFTHPELINTAVQVHDSMGLIKLIHETQLLDAPLNKIFIEILKYGEATSRQLADIFDFSESKMNTYLSDLQMFGCIGAKKEGGLYKYFVNDIWKSETFPSGPIIPLVFQYNLLSDDTRVEGFKGAIERVVKDSDVVADLGAGVGLLSHFASRRAKKIYTVEIEPNVLNKGLEILKENRINNVKYLRGDARFITLPEMVDVIICEMCDTAFVSELQVPVINHALENYLKPGGTVIPYCAKTTMQLVYTNYMFEDSVFRLIHYEAYGSKESISLSEEVTYHTIYFQRVNPEFVDNEVVLTATSDGIVNGVRIKTYVKGAKELDYILPSQWFNPPAVLPTENINMKKGEKIKVRIKYLLGRSWSNVQCKIIGG